ncbi:MAG: pyrroline-5-carboxylate reductase [Myxococcota bacterium]
MSWTLGFVGCGVMAEVMIAGLLDEGLLNPEQILASNRRESRGVELRDTYGIRTTTDNQEVVSTSDVVVLSVKPQTLASVLAEVNGSVPSTSLVLSIVAGASMRVLSHGLGHDRVARCMPNLPCRIREGMTVWAAPSDTSDTDVDRIEQILGVMGGVIRVADESHVDKATAVNGTGPAIVAQFVKAMLEGAAYIGESRTVAKETVLATLVGTAKMLQQSDGHVAELIDEVTSPGGTTSRALQVLKQGRFSAVLTESVDAAYQRTLELGQQLEDNLS